jgi:hypothetical protein
MNERIRELWDLSRNPSGRGHDEQKFAELIVEEMYDFMCKATDNDGAWPSSKEVKQHFGVDGMSTEDKKKLIKELLGVKNETNQ